MSVASLDLLIASKVAFGCFLFAVVIIMAVIDVREMILPNRLNLLLAAGGVGQAILVGNPRPANAALGALLAFVILSAVALLFRHDRGIDGLGLGDQKFSAAAGLWIGWEAIAPMLLVASCSALIFVALRSVNGGAFSRASRLPFGPFLGIGTVACWLFAAVPGS
jgi:leader peptidase (prepilin peptidase)/N-methyltransferase